MRPFLRIPASELSFAPARNGGLVNTLAAASRRSRAAVATLLCAGILFLAAGSASGQTSYPTRPIRVIVPQAYGGTSDLLARMLGEQLEKALGVAVIVEAKPGASGIIGNELAKRAPPDGYTLLAASTATHAMVPHVVATLPYDPIADFVPVINLVYQTKVVLVNTSLGVTTLRELVALVRSRPGQINYASTGTGTSSHLDTEQLAALTGMNMLHVPYKGSGQTVAALIANEVQVLLASVTAAKAALASGRVRPLAVLADRRSPLMPDVPTIEEEGLPRLDVQTWIGFLAPVGTPATIVDHLNVTLNRILGSKSTREWLEVQGLEAIGGSPKEFDAEIRADLDKWGKVTRGLGIRKQ
jgi:tripartite-type tricarboxylate transporter receptor subunit TctC